MPALQLFVKHVRDAATPADGRRVLVDRLWPRGVSRERAAVDEWMRDLAPSDELRRWFGHDPGRFDGFARRYRSELADRRSDLSRLRRLAREGPVTLLFAAHDREHNNAVVLAEVIRRGLRQPPDPG